MKIKGTVALVTGANRGLGLSFVEALIEFGAAKIYATARDPEALSPLVGKYPDQVTPLALDVTRQDQVDAAVINAPDVTLLINNAGALVQRGLIEANDLSGLELEMAVNVYGVARMCQGFAPVIEANGGGAIANMLSNASMVNFPAFGTYSASKAAAMSLTDCLRYEVLERGIEVFGVYAGFIDTDMIDNISGEKTSPSEIANNTLRGIEAGDVDIDTDHKVKNTRQELRNDPEGLKAAAWERARIFRKEHPL